MLTYEVREEFQIAQIREFIYRRGAGVLASLRARRIDRPLALLYPDYRIHEWNIKIIFSEIKSSNSLYGFGRFEVGELFMGLR